MNDKTSYWLELAEYDLETARAMLQTGRYLYVGFMCHQVVEKALKAVIAAKGEFPPKIHRLRRLAELGNVYDRMNNEQRSFLDMLEPLNLEGRYPGDINQLAAEFNPDRCVSIINETGELLAWTRVTL